MEDSQALVKNLQTFSKMVNALFNLKSQIFSFLDTILTILDPDRGIGIANTNPDPGEPFQYGSTWIRIRNTGFYPPFIGVILRLGS